jgi:hypothetical protein
MQKSINSIVRIFPDHEEKIEYLFMYDSSFRELCADYMLCASQILELKSESGDYQVKLEEYEELQRSLEHEILKLILVSKDNLKNE